MAEDKLPIKVDDGNDGSDVSTTRRPMEAIEATTLDDLKVQNHIYQQLALGKVSGHGSMTVSKYHIYIYGCNIHIFMYLFICFGGPTSSYTSDTIPSIPDCVCVN